MKLILCLVAVFAVQYLGVASNAKTVVKKLVSEEDVAVALAEYIASLSNDMREKASFSVVLSGGSLIYTMRKLCEPEYKTKIDWSKWIVFWVDERVVPLNDSLSNYKLALDGFFSKVPIPQSNIYPIKYMKSPAAVARDYEARLKKLVAKKIIPLSDAGFPKFDLMLLGIGPDGHVASLFPNRQQRYEKKRWVTFITDSPKPPPERITFTFPVINSASNTAMVVTDAEEADAVAAALGAVVVTPPLPCAEVKAEELTWFLDKEAASKLHS
ncbi:NagB/RpiA/CoA transferase-like superfamily protein [Perilla frutescens var. hirtella]|uniref:Probable 6-phosphogluconolactonase n=1 Tax=Perilla frutescens var. hirtella TaxID=608512 RepID=A0AAD4JRY3_PERFH|nr:NagB/RpiA/CoA transferase-like superfamily protein [Perilla frutescens var. hirtella]